MRGLINRLYVGRKRGLRLYLLTALLCCVVSARAWAADIQVRAELSPGQFALGQIARFVVTVTGVRSAEPDMPVAEGFHFTYQGQSSQASWVNGTISSSIVYNFHVYADKVGSFTIAPVQVTVKGKVYTSDSVQGTVLPAQNLGQAAGPFGASTTAVAPGADEIKNIGFMRIMPETERMYSGQVVPFTLKAYFQARKRITLKSVPRLSREDFLLQSLSEEPIQQKERVNGSLYSSLTWQGTLVAVKEGSFPLLMEMDAEVVVPSRARRRGNSFDSSLLDDPFFSGILGNYSRREIKVISQEKELTVLDLPTENRPEDFSGAIGTFRLKVAASPLNGKVGDPVSVKMQLEGTGNFALVQAPVLSEKKGWKVYPASGAVQDLGAGNGLKIFEQALVPTKQSLTAVPPMRFSYFDPQAEEYQTLTSDPISLHLQAGAEPSVDQANPPSPQFNKNQQKDAQNAGGKTSVTLPHQYLAPLQPELGKLVPSIQPLYQKMWFQLLMALALLCLLLALVLHLKQRRLAKDPSILRHKKVQGRLITHYEGMNKAVATPDQESFHQHCRAAIQQRTGEVWGLAPEAVTLADLEQRLPADAPLRVVFTRLEQSGYAGEQLSQAELEEILHTTQNELDKLA